MADLDLSWGQDLSQDASGDLALVEGSEETKQHIIRRLYSAVTAYIWTTAYGVGLPERIGNVAKPSNIAAVVRSAMKLEATISPLPVPVVTVTESSINLGLFVIAIKYKDAVTGQPVALQFKVQSS